MRGSGGVIKRAELFIRPHNETLAVVAMCVCNPDRSLPVGANLGLRLNYEFLRQPVCSLFYLQSITIIPIITTTPIQAAHMT
jgi:hypothetical protein